MQSRPVTYNAAHGDPQPLRWSGLHFPLSRTQTVPLAPCASDTLPLFGLLTGQACSSFRIVADSLSVCSAISFPSQDTTLPTCLSRLRCALLRQGFSVPPELLSSDLYGILLCLYSLIRLFIVCFPCWIVDSKGARTSCAHLSARHWIDGCTVMRGWMDG